MKNQRLDKIISSQTKLSRKEAALQIKQGFLSLNGSVVTRPDEKADPENDIIVFNGERLEYKQYIYIMMNKPKGVISASTDKNAETVLDLVPAQWRRDGLFPAGRLDRDTTGFMLITDDGNFAHEILSPRKHIEKTYVAELEKPLSQADAETLEKGITLADGTSFDRCSIKILNENANIAEIRIHEGKYHQIKRMFAFVGNQVVELRRTAMGNLTIDIGLGEGECRLILPHELKLISNFDE
jgi:16S rRNA pseudouridine516 synthase